MANPDPVHVHLVAHGPVLAARDRVREMLCDAEASHGPILLDATGLTFSSRTAAAELLDAVRRWRATGRTVAWQSVGTDVAKMLRAVDPTIDVEVVGDEE